MRLLGISLTPGQSGDAPQAYELIQTAFRHGATHIVADRAYDTNAILEQIRTRKACAVIPPNPNRVLQRPYDKTIYRQRNVAERFIARLKENRRVATRYEKLAAHYLGFILLAAIKNYLNIIC